MKVFRPWAFQGSLSQRKYFEGWYFKHVSSDLKDVWSFIPGISLSPDGQESFIQVLNGRTGASQVYTYKLDAFSASGKELDIHLGKSHFTAEGISLDLQNKSQKIQGDIFYSAQDKYPSSLFKPGIMGWYSFVPLMECKHGVVSMYHSLTGGLQIDKDYIDFENGSGYIEKDWGSSFPESWIWLHCNTFDSSHSSFMFSVAKIPWLGSYFIGFISYLKLEDRFINLSTWSNAKIDKLVYLDKVLQVCISNRSYHLEIKAVNSRSGPLKAPSLGSMNRIIKETVDAEIELKLSSRSGNTLFYDKGSRAGMELIDKILTYF